MAETMPGTPNDDNEPITAGGDSGVKFTLDAPVPDKSNVRRKPTQQEMADYFVHGKPPKP